MVDGRMIGRMIGRMSECQWLDSGLQRVEDEYGVVENGILECR